MTRTLTNDEKVELTRELSSLFDDGLSFETSIEELDIKPDTPEYNLARDLWDSWESDREGE